MIDNKVIFGSAQPLMLTPLEEAQLFVAVAPTPNQGWTYCCGCSKPVSWQDVDVLTNNQRGPIFIAFNLLRVGWRVASRGRYDYYILCPQCVNPPAPKTSISASALHIDYVPLPA